MIRSAINNRGRGVSSGGSSRQDVVKLSFLTNNIDSTNTQAEDSVTVMNPGVPLSVSQTDGDQS